MNMVAAALPEDIILDILMRLSVKSLVRFRCVCKLWLSLINDSYFIRKHTDRVNLGNANEIAILCFNSAPSASHINKIKYSEIIEGGGGGGGVGDGNHQDDKLNNPTTELLIKEINFPGELKSGGFRVKSTCDGLILLFVDSLNSPLLWNPSIEEYKILSLSPLQQSCNFPSVYGIGYDPSIDDYKVLRAPSSVSSKHSESVEVLSLKSNSWKTIQDKFPYEIYHKNSATFLNGALHWMATCKVTRERVILQFNVREETFGELQLPNFIDKLLYRYECTLQVFGGNLCFCVLDTLTQEGTLDVWVMKEYGVKESWTKLLTFRPPAAETIDLYCYTQNGILVLNSLTCEFLMYNQREETFRKISNIIDSMGSITSSIAYVKSLVSPLKYCNSS